MKITIKQLAATAVLLALCIISQIFKNLSVYITGPIINAAICICALIAGPVCAVILSIITPITAFFIAGSPIMAALPQIILFIMGGNIIIALMTYFLFKPAISNGNKLINVRSVLFAILSAVAKAVFMGLTISLWLLPTFIPAGSPLAEKMHVFQATFSISQLITALIGFVLVFILWIPVKKIFESPE